MGYSTIVVGATGLVGTALVDQLAETPNINKIITLTRRPSSHSSSKVHNHVIDFERLDDYSELFCVDILFSCLGTTRKQAGSLSAQRKVDFDFQYKVAQIAANQGVSHYLLVSSASAHVNSNNKYLQMKGQLEQQVQSLDFSRISIFQPSLLVGDRPDVRIGEKLGNIILPVLCLLPAFRQFRPITGGEVAEKMLKVSQQSGSPLEWFKLDELFG